MNPRQKLVCNPPLVCKRWTLVFIKAGSKSKKIRLLLFSSFLEMIIEKKPGRPIFSLVYLCLIFCLLIETRKKTKITVTTFIQVQKIVKTPLLAWYLLKSKNKINKPKSSKALARSNAITVKKWVIMLLIIVIKNQKTSFDFKNLFIDNLGPDKGYFCSIFASQVSGFCY